MTRAFGESFTRVMAEMKKLLLTGLVLLATGCATTSVEQSDEDLLEIQREAPKPVRDGDEPLPEVEAIPQDVTPAVVTAPSGMFGRFDLNSIWSTGLTGFP